MSKITLTNLASMQNDNTVMATLNANNTIIQTAVDNTLSRDGTIPNQMAANLDMNSERIINLPYPVTDQEPLRFGDFKTFTITPTIGATAYDINWTTPSTGGTTKSIGVVLQRTFDVRDFGAVCNGSTDDTLAIQRCINAAEAAGNDSIVLLHKSSLISASLNITSPVIIQGNGKSNTFLFQSNASVPIINVSPTSANQSIKLRGFGCYFQVTPTLGSPAGIAFGNSSFNCTDCTVEDVSVVNSGTGIYFQNIINTRILNCDVQLYSVDGIRINCPINPDSGGINIDGCNITAPTSSSRTHAINWNNGGGIRISNNFLGGSVVATGGIGLFFNMTAATTEFQLCNNLIVDYAVGIQMIRNPGLFMYQMLINDNIFDGNRTSIYVPPDTGIWVQMLTITGNGFQGASGSTGPQISIADTAGCTISGNTFLSNVTNMICIQTISSCQDFKIGPNARTVQLNGGSGTLAADQIAGTNMTIIGGG